MATSRASTKKSKTSQPSIQRRGFGAEAYIDIDWRSLSDEEAKAQEREGSLAWKILSNTQMQTLQDLPVEELEKKIAEILKLNNHHVDLNEGVLLDYYVSCFWWAKEQNFSVQQISGFITVLHTLLENIKEKKLSLVNNLKEFKKMLIGVGNENSELSGGLDFFDVNQAKTLSDFLQQTFFQHYKLYEFLFHQEREEQIVCREEKLVIEVLPKADLPYPPPLDEGIDEDIYSSYIATPVSSPEGDGEAVTEDKEGEKDISAATTPLPPMESPAVDLVQSEGGPETPAVDPLEGVTADDVKRIMDEVARDMLGDLQADIGKKLKERESEIIARINKIHRIADS